MKCAYCAHEKTTKNPVNDTLLKEKLQRMDDFKKGKSGPKGTIPVEGDPRFPEKHPWQVRDEKRRELTRKVIKKAKPVKVPKPFIIDK